MLEEEASLSGECGITNETGGKVDISVPLDNLNFAYKGSTSGNLTVAKTAVLGNNSEISNNIKGGVAFSGKLKENGKINLGGNSTGGFTFGEHGIWEGSSKIINNGYGKIELDRLTVPDGTTIEYTSKGGSLVINNAGGGITTIEPGAHLNFVNNNTRNASFANWSNLYIKDCLLTLGGSGSAGVIVNYRFGGELNVNNDGDCLVSLDNSRTDWSGQTIRSRIYNLQKYTDKYLYVNTGNIKGSIDVEAHCRVWLYGSYADGTKIRVNGNTDYGHLNFQGNNSGEINIEFNAPSHSTTLIFYNDLDGLDGFSYTSAKNGWLTVNKGVVLGRNIKIVNNSLKSIYIAKNVKIGNDVQINVSESNDDNIIIEKDLPDGTVVSY